MSYKTICHVSIADPNQPNQRPRGVWALWRKSHVISVRRLNNHYLTVLASTDQISCDVKGGCQFLTEN